MTTLLIYLAGAATIPSGVLLLALAQRLAKVFLKVHLTVFGKATPQSRAALAAVTYAAERAWVMGGGDYAVILLRGLDAEERRTAMTRLRPTPPTIRLNPDFVKRMEGEA